ncbi:ubiquitin binding protein [Testicularia cyperi]|uniref:Vacuolar protein sorting-associated protein 27 n=1 Tax=Testicularia cyperi TaxID=1882483 RepID=A0A317Y109_9BASI|nr:ubiquitin binding protein [Testicularia cyperi]
MSALWSGWGADAFTEQVEKATSELLPIGSEDIALNLEICDQVRAKQVQPKQAMQVIKRRVSHKNPNVVLLALGLTDICIKNGGDHFLQEVASREFMDNLVSVLKSPSGVNHDVKAKALGLIQSWAQIAEAKPDQMEYIISVYKLLKSDSRFEFPPRDPNVVASAALVETLTAPEWVDGEVCMRCRTAFTTFNRKHHCRNCGNVFCQQCSSHNMSLPWFGIGQDVRVCDGCYNRKGPPKNATKLSRSKSAGSTSSSSQRYNPSGRGASASHLHQRSSTLGSSPSKSSRRSAARQKEEDDLAMAIKLSLESSGQSSVPTSSRPDAFSTPSQPSAARGSSSTQSNGRMLEGTDAEDDPDLAAAIAASLRDWAPPQPSAPDGLNDAATAPGPPVPGATGGARSDLPLPPSLDLAPQDIDNILTFSQTVQAQQAHNHRTGMHGAPLDQRTQALYEKASSARPRVARNLEEGHRRHNVLVSMHDKLSEAVKLYDQLLDAQMSRPAQLYASAYPGYGPAANPTANAYTPYGYESTPTPSHAGGVPYGQLPPQQHQYPSFQQTQQHPAHQHALSPAPSSLYPQQHELHQQHSSQPSQQASTPSHVRPELQVQTQPEAPGAPHAQHAQQYPSSPMSHAQQQQQSQPPQTQQQQQNPPPPQAQHAKADLGHLPLFPVAPHADNRLGPNSEAISPAVSLHTNAPSSAGMWQTSPVKGPNAPNGIAESPLIEL